MSDIKPNEAAAVAALVLCLSGPVAAQDADTPHARAFLRSYDVVPAVSSPAVSEFRAWLVPDVSEIGEVREIRWELRFSGLQGSVWRQADIHFNQRGVNGNIVALLCTDLQTVPGFVPECPAEGMVAGVITPDHVWSLAATQGIEAGEFLELLHAIRAGAVYVDIHSDRFPNGELRGQIVTGRRRHLP